MVKFADNPILRGFNPDPSIIRVGADYYIAVSTFEWFPGVQIYHSRDLRNWQLIARPLNRISQLDMRGNPDSCGVWAPCLSYDEGVFFLVYSNVRSFDGVWKDTPNYLVTTENIRGDWSEPVFLNSSGFDASLFHDEDGKKWLTNMLADHRKGKFFGGVVLQEFEAATQKLIGPVHHIFGNTDLGKTEGPHIYRHNGYYYLLLAEGGTEYGHAVTIARSKAITGPYEVHPANPFISTKDTPNHPLQKTGHADLVETKSGEWYIVFLTGRPLKPLGKCILGRETAIEKIVWKEDGWPYLENGAVVPRQRVPIPDLPEHIFPKELKKDDFDEGELNNRFQSLRVPISEEWCSLSARAGFCRLWGRESLSSLHNQSLIARRVQDFHMEASTCLEFSPETFQQMAGLVCYYNTGHFHYCHVSGGEAGSKKLLHIITCDNFEMTEPLEEEVDVTGIDRIMLRVVIKRAELQFYFAKEKGEWQPLGPTLDASILSDDYVMSGAARYRPAFTGAFVGICCQDLSGRGLYADFDWFAYREGGGVRGQGTGGRSQGAGGREPVLSSPKDQGSGRNR